MDSAAPTPEPISEKYFGELLNDLGSDDAFQRDQAVVRMAQHGFGVVQALISILSDFAKPGLAGVAKSLGKIGDRRAIPVLAQAAKMGDEDLRTAAVWALAQFHEPEVLPILLSEADRPHPTIQSFLAYTLGSFQDSRVVPVLSKLAEHPNREVAFQAASALGEIGDKEAISILQRSWRRPDPLVKAVSAVALRRLGGRPRRFATSTIILVALALVAMGAGLGWFFYR